MKQYHTLVVKEKSKFEHFTIRVPRGQNEKADRLARLVSSVVENLNHRIFIECLLEPRTEATGNEVNVASPEPEWASRIMKYLKNGELPENKDEVRKVRIRASWYLFLGDTLYKRSFALPLLRCLFEEEVDYML